MPRFLPPSDTRFYLDPPFDLIRPDIFNDCLPSLYSYALIIKGLFSAGRIGTTAFDDDQGVRYKLLLHILTRRRFFQKIFG